MMWYGSGGMGPLMVLVGIPMLVFWAGIGGLVVCGVATVAKQHRPGVTCIAPGLQGGRQC